MVFGKDVALFAMMKSQQVNTQEREKFDVRDADPEKLGSRMFDCILAYPYTKL